MPLVLLACPGTKEKLATAALADGCYINTDCVTPLVCAFKRCHNACTTDRDCGPGLLCVVSDQPFRVCLLPQEVACTYNTDCPPNLLCAANGGCHPQCLTQRDCVAGQLCAQGACALPAQVSDAGNLIVPPTVDAGTTTQCAYSSECSGSLVCKSGQCLPECKSDRDCRASELCVLPEGRCDVRAGPAIDAGSGSGRQCLLNSDCPKEEVCGLDGRCRYQCVEARDCPPGDCCYAHTCRPQSVCANLLPDGGIPPFDGGTFDGGAAYCLNDLGCGDNDFCNGIELCVNNRCQPADHAICDDFNPCTIDMCNAVAKSCSYASSGLDAGDDDGDGHYAVKCGPGADDCDDTNPNVYWGRPEECDFVDNNCNGAVDEGLWRERSGARISLNGTARYPWWAGKPAVVRVDGGFVAAASSDTIDGAFEAFRLDGQLGPVTGPVELFRSSTQWEFAPSSPNLFGRRLVRPTLSVNPSGQVLASAWVADAPGTTTCSAGAPWVQRSVVVATTGQLSPVVPWEDVDFDGAGLTCPFTVSPELQSTFTAPSIAWSPGASRWVVAWGSDYSTIIKDMQAGYFDADGGIPVRHPLLPAPDPNRYYTPGSTAVAPPLIAVGPNNVFVAFYGLASGHVQFFLMDPSLTSRITPIQEIYVGSTVPNAVGVSPRGYFLVARYGTQTEMRFVSPTTGLQIGGVWLIESPTVSNLLAPRGHDSTGDLAIIPLRDAFLSIEQDWPNATVSLNSAAVDGGGVSFQLTLPSTPRSGFTLAPIDDRTVGVLWTDGQLKRTILECGN